MQHGTDIYGNEESNGVRFSWNVWPYSKLDATRMAVPLACLYSPNKNVKDMPPALAYDPIRCSSCGSVLNPHVHLDFASKLWGCPFCSARNNFPPHYAENITETNLPPELIPNYTTVEYELQSQTQFDSSNYKPSILFVVDTCMDRKELSELKDSMIQTINLLPEETNVGLITFGTHVQVHEIGFSDIPRQYVLRGDRSAEYYTPARLQELLGIQPAGQSRQQQSRPGPPSSTPGSRPDVSSSSSSLAVGRFLVPLSDCSFQLSSSIEDLTPDPWPCRSDTRPSRCVGAALSTALSLLELAVPRCGGRVTLFLSGPCSKGPGATVDPSRLESIRSHADIKKVGNSIANFIHSTSTSTSSSTSSMTGKANESKGLSSLFSATSPTPQAIGNPSRYFRPACDYYATLTHRALTNHHVVDVFACSLDQVGLVELSVLINRTGGVMMMGESFAQSCFKESLKKLFSRPADGGSMQMGFDAVLEVHCSREVKILGAIGPCSSQHKVTPAVLPETVGSGNSGNGVGETGTSAWYLGGITPETTLSIFFDVTGSPSTPTSQAGGALTTGGGANSAAAGYPVSSLGRNPMMTMTSQPTVPSTSSSTSTLAFKKRVLQFTTTYQHVTGAIRLRVTTVSGGWMVGDDWTSVAKSFDQETACAILARLIVTKTENRHGGLSGCGGEDIPDVMRWLDRTVIRLCQKFAHFDKEQVNTFRLDKEFSSFPQSIFHLRRSQFMQLLNYSPDESLYNRSILCKESSMHATLMIQPSLLSYSFNNPSNIAATTTAGGQVIDFRPLPVNLDSSSVKPDILLLLDTFFNVVVFRGENVANWANQGYHNMPEHDNFKRLLESPQNDAQIIMSDRFPVPKYVICDQHKSDARFVMAKLNPSLTHHTLPGSNESGVVTTDDVSLRVFMEHLVKAVVFA